MSKNCSVLHGWFNGNEKFSFPFDESEIPFQNGVYVLFEKGELAHSTRRIVRIGTHTGQDKLRSRLSQHFLKNNKDGSIFRKNIGRALLNRDKDSFLKSWDLTTKRAKEQYSGLIDLTRQKEVERRVSECIQNNFCFAIFRTDDKNKRLSLESRIISTVSLCKECRPSENWLGKSSPKKKIRESGLWLVNELWKTPLNDEDMAELKQML